MDDKTISLAHGSGGKLMHDLIKDLFLRKFDNPLLSHMSDSAILNIGETKVAFTTDTYVVKPIFFPRGDIGKLAVCGTVNDLSVTGAQPICISCGLIIEEGFGYESLEKIIDSMKEAACDAGIEIVTGDTKVVEKGTGDGIFINTSGVGVVEKKVLTLEDIHVGDKIIINGGVGEHGIAVLSAREELGLNSNIESDCASLNGLISKILNCSDKVRFMRDPTRGGLATTLNEIVEGRDFGIIIDEEEIPVKDYVKGACEILGFDPLYIANEGKVVIVAAAEDVRRIIDGMREEPFGKDAELIGEVVSQHKGRVCMKTLSGGTRIVDMLTGEQLPRIC
ncbi:MAG: hydrogenase expression/formation protein HypE [Candidatus Cloacimonadota bacterium]|nr:MAG: hydrogenase expression/formation protein HypE [Candidatus Cloacimonadota bacterium]